MVLVFSACQDGPDCCTNISTDVNMTVRGSDGADRLNPDNQGAFRAEDIDLFYLINGETKRFFRGNLDNPKNFFIDTTRTPHVITIIPNDAETEPYPVTYIQWNDDDTDTLRCAFHRTENSVVCTKVWYNDELKWETNQGGRVFEIVK